MEKKDKITLEVEGDKKSTNPKMYAKREFVSNTGQIGGKEDRERMGWRKHFLWHNIWTASKTSFFSKMNRTLRSDFCKKTLAPRVRAHRRPRRKGRSTPVGRSDLPWRLTPHFASPSLALAQAAASETLCGGLRRELNLCQSLLRTFGVFHRSSCGSYCSRWYLCSDFRMD